MIVDDAKPSDDDVGVMPRASDDVREMAEGTGSGEMPAIVAHGSIDPDRPQSRELVVESTVIPDPADEPSLVAWDPEALEGGAALARDVARESNMIPADIGLESAAPRFGAPAPAKIEHDEQAPEVPESEESSERKSSRFLLAEEHRRKRTRR